MLFPNTGPSAPAETAAYSAEGESKARASRKPEVFEWPASAQFRGKWSFQILRYRFWIEQNVPLIPTG